MTSGTEKSPATDVALLFVAGAGLVLSVVSVPLLGWRALGGTVLGALLAGSNLWALGRLVRLYLYNGKATWAIVGALKMVALLVIVYGLLRGGVVGALELMLGYAALPLGIVAAQLRPASPVEEKR
jgi:hypothetical protein